MRRLGCKAAVVAAVVATATFSALAGAASPASAAASDGFGVPTIGGTAGAYSGTIAMPTGFPDATFTSDSGNQVPRPGIVAGSSFWIPATTAFGAAFGSSQGRAYLNLKPTANSAGSVSTTTYTFSEPTPAGSWGIALGDIDAERLTVSATDADGSPLTAAELGVEPAFNACDAAPRASACSGLAAPYPVPSVSADATSISVSEPDCPGASCDTTGESVWLRPTVPVRAITVADAWVSGSPLYQTWFATIAHAVRGTVAQPCGPADDYRVQLVDGAGAVLATTTATAGGEYAFADVAARADAVVRVDPASLRAGATSAPAPADTSGGDVVADLAIDQTCYPVTGSVAADGDPVADAAVHVVEAGATDPIEIVHTDAAGDFALTPLPNGRYSIAVDAPEGTMVRPSRHAITVDGAAVAVPAFAVVPEAAPAPTPSPDPSGGTGSASGGSATGDGADAATGGRLAATGVDPLPWIVAAGLLAGGGILTLVRTRRRRP